MRSFAIAAIVVFAASATFAAEMSGATVNPYNHLESSRDELARTYPELSEVELDKLVFRIGEARSTKALSEQIASAN